MNTVRQFTFKNPHPDGDTGMVGAAIAQWLESRYPQAAAEFLGLFAHTADDGAYSIAGVGSEFQVESRKQGDTLHLCLKHRGSVLREVSYALAGRDLHEEVFGHAAHFVYGARVLLMGTHQLPPSTMLLGGWRCGTHPDEMQEPLIFTIPRIACHVTREACVFTLLGDESDADIIQAMSDLPREVSPSTPLKIAGRRDIPECRDYIGALSEMIASLSQEANDKVVICREVRLFLQSAVSPVDLLLMAASGKPAKYRYVFRWLDGEAWVGVSPEMLVSKQGANIVVEPLAGTRKGSDAKDKSERYRQELLNDGKEIEEHETAARMFLDMLGQVCEPASIQQLESRGIIDLGYVQHLKSKIAATLRPDCNVFHLLAAIYPPATIWGKPVALSGERIRRHEHIERDFFTGGFGFFTLNDDANFALAIRTARMTHNEVRVYAGSGIVRRSDPYREWLETSNKMKPFLDNPYTVYS
ncbi:chorismate-binding protein [Dyella sp. M7H15-1]|uniref:chorismate-binding protein n=1 Tax=Dyella sp. M7H15-1 TaxID=2501295 RepID=UPI0013E8EE7E|nr:chorismate-binding protein [Dyella sp. M7H15-1]